MEFFDIMKRASDDVEMQFSEDTYNKFIIYKSLLQEWNEKINLTAITDDDGIIKKHFIDCIKAFKFNGLKGNVKIIDVGTGAGFPGLPLGIMNSASEVVLLDSLNKRLNFLNLVIGELGLKNFTTIHGRAEENSRKKDFREKFDIATSRAVANLSVLSEFCLPYVKVGGYFVALKGPAVDEEISEAKNMIGQLGGKIKEVIEINIEDTDLKHNLVVIEKIKNTPDVYPRKMSSINKKKIKK
ncbi:MAG: 16S rRNA (guanine(527)-N(7))-methyltransferase RsmG [Clostridium sp.]|uniref:16S rRNA (guanine(527)-N(7))-methyltransferase RsmG n=1 Tax=Clostridium sp. TaxID=1506 RepID=UPI002A866D99|nr:16S rRNA (guanine(527)-N(7))-methyltransferase RsmG [Clostridium sp.]MDY5096627.1 16S rRNA (guanine(527)-N(7))-methyltransferase RsmG [Clostridium sp.]